ncbi:MAG TPA: phage terminase large subunit family protein, partial [Pyrinomonadaceae bacterium]|nr:phage terminase large subunit family protein [Pyrinomonadaceae bacterium]
MSGAISNRVVETFRRARQTAIPLTTLSVSAWAAAYRYLPAERADQSGRWRNEVVPYLVEPMDTVGKPGVTEIIFVKSAQVGGSEFLNNVLGYFAHIEPCPILFVAEDEKKAEAWSKESFAPTVRETPVLSRLFGAARERDSGNTIQGKMFPGGHLAIAWATSPSTLSSRPRRVVLMDERDAFLPTREGDPVKLAEKRTLTFRERKVIIKVSTPRNRLENPPGSAPDAPRYSPIEWDYELSDKRKYHVPCPHCGEYQVLSWKNVVWDDGDPLSAVYMCVANGCVIEHAHKGEMLARGHWVAEKPLTGCAGFWINELYSPFTSWGEMARDFLKAKKSPETLKVFVNTSLAEGWEDLAEMASIDDLAARCEPYEAEAPDGVLVITASADIQGDRIETEIVGWGLDDESWSLDYRVIEGDPAKRTVWDELKELWLTPLRRSDGTEMRVAAACVDSGGHHTDEVYRFCAENAGRRWRAVKGANTPGKPLVSKPTMQGKPPHRVKLYTVGTETAKDTLAARLSIGESGPGYCHFPEGRDEDYFRQLRSERPTMRAGVRRWEKVRASMRNEGLDLRVYATAALAILNPNWRALRAGVRKRAAETEVEASPPGEAAT